MEVFTIPLSDSQDTSEKFIIYRPLINLAFVGNRALANFVNQLSKSSIQGIPSLFQEYSDILSFLETIGFLEEDSQPIGARNTDFFPTTAVLLLTNRCQLRCVYCYASAGERPVQDLIPELGYTVIDTVANNAQEKGLGEFDLTFHGGGEPTLNWATMQKCTLYARNKPLKSKVTLTSNGIWTLAQTHWIMDNLDSLSISMDGSPTTQDRSRPFISGKNSSARIMMSINLLDQRSYPYGIRMTATTPWEYLLNDVRFICENTGCKSIQVEPAYNISRGGHGRPDQSAIKGFSEAFLDAHDLATNYGRKFYYSGARLGVVTDTFCTAPYNALIVNANGELVTCYEIAGHQHALMAISIIGGVNEGEVTINHTARDYLHQLVAERRATCRDCFCYWSCAGDCYTRSFQDGPNGHLTRSGRCEVNRAITTKMLLTKIAESENGVYKAK